MGRLAKPTALKELGGNAGKRALNKKEPKPFGGPVKPAVMTASAKKIWDKVVVSMPPGVFTAADSHLLGAYCEAVARHEAATKAIIKGDAEVTGSTGQVKVNPWYREQADAARLIVTIGAKLGLDPVSRQHIHSDKDSSNNDDGFGDFLN
ncbi:phage terminase small subunit P27 family [Sphingobium sp. PNB]|uniref:phage terminase small subunit P27 family n=1 Tax=Sphingobium sp. PNB TaxID=863934 RepID=UPI001CA42B3B|nr:phage terminase small subunit P27 family [Sphingobium sp. PNB]MCB4861961.1 phage terminase small subunit P27 family [Sphingobium sp. PNB]